MFAGISLIINSNAAGMSKTMQYPRGFQTFFNPKPFDLNYLLEVPPEIFCKYFNNLMAQLYV